MYVLYSLTILFYLFSILMAQLFVFSTVRLPLFFLCGKIYIMWFIHRRKVDVIK